MSIWDQFANPLEDDDEKKINTPDPKEEEEEPIKEVDEDNDEDREEEEEETDPNPETEPAIREDDNDDDDGFSFAPVIEDLADKGILYYDPEKEYEDGEEGFEEVLEDTVNHRFDSMIANFSPAAQRLIEIELAGGDIAEAFQEHESFDYAAVPLDDTDNLRQLVTDHFEALGYEEEDIRQELLTIEERGDRELLNKAKVAQKYLIKKQEEDRKANAEAIRARTEQEEIDRIKSLEMLRDDIVSTTEIAGIKVTKGMQKQLYEHMTKPVGPKGETQLQLNRRSKEAQLAAALFDMLGYDASDIERKAATKVAGKLKKSLSRYQDMNATKVSGSRQVTTPQSSVKIPKGVWDRGFSED